ncbi:hypothetical protein W7U_09005 [Mycobacterium sp. H4Y]|nr:hypothetical protein W7U_09005 [Mycobacterium sp. H4Y]
MTTEHDAPQSVSQGVERRLYELMVLMKAADDRLSKGIGTGEFMCVYWPSRGQEAIAAAMGVALRPDDQLVTTYRGLHDLIGKGVQLEEIYGEMMGRTVGAGRGKGGTMHIANPAKGVMLSTGIVGAGPPVAVGLAMAAKRKGIDRVTVVSFGDGATNTGSFHEAAKGICRIGHGRNAFAEPRGVVHAHPRDEGDRALHPTRRQGAADRGDLRPRSVPVRRNDSVAEQEGPRPHRARVLHPARAGRHQAAGHRRQRDRLRSLRARRAERRAHAGRAGCQRRGDRPAHPGAARRRHHRGVRAPHAPSRDRP